MENNALHVAALRKWTDGLTLIISDPEFGLDEDNNVSQANERPILNSLWNHHNHDIKILKNKFNSYVSTVNNSGHKFMMTSSNGNIFRVTGHFAGDSPVSGELPAQRPVTRSFDVSFDLGVNKRLSRQSCWWFETLSLPLWRHCNVPTSNDSSCVVTCIRMQKLRTDFNRVHCKNHNYNKDNFTRLKYFIMHMIKTEIHYCFHRNDLP